MRLEENPLLPAGIEPALAQVLARVLRSIAQKVNQLADGRISAIDNAALAPPTTGQWLRGDVVRNALPVESGAPGSRFVVFGWICVASGSPGTFLPLQIPTGN